MKEDILELKKVLELQEQLQEQLREKKLLFQAENKLLLDNLMNNEGIIIDLKKVISEQALKAFKQDKTVKKFFGGVGVRVGSSISYDEKEAMFWCLGNMPVAIKSVLDKKMFETYAKTNSLEFVNVSDKVTVTFPKQIKGE